MDTFQTIATVIFAACLIPLVVAVMTLRGRTVAAPEGERRLLAAVGIAIVGAFGYNLLSFVPALIAGNVMQIAVSVFALGLLAFVVRVVIRRYRAATVALANGGEYAASTPAEIRRTRFDTWAIIVFAFLALASVFLMMFGGVFTAISGAGA